MSSARRMLLLVRQPPLRGALALEALDSALVAAAFDQEISVLFREEGVWQLLRRAVSDPGLDALENLAGMGVERLYVCAQSLQDRGLTRNDLALPVEILDDPAQARLLAEQHLVLND